MLSMNRLTAIAVLSIGLAATGSPQNSPGKQSDKAQSNPSPTVTKIENSTSNNEADRATQKTPEPHSGIEWSNWALVLVGTAGVGAAILTLRAIKKQTDLQAVAYTQWIKIENWEATAQPIAPSDQAPYREMLIGLDIVNGSEFPLTMKSAAVRHAGYLVFESTNDVFLPPHTPHRIRFVVQITSAEFDVWEKAIISIPLQGDLESTGVLKILIYQPFKGILISQKGKAPYFHYEISIVPAGKPEANQKAK
jgi:hypothetical protein